MASTSATTLAVATCSVTFALLIVLAAVRTAVPSSDAFIEDEYFVIRAASFAFGTNAALLCVCTIQALFTRLPAKRATARLLALYFLGMALALALFVSRTVPSPRGLYRDVRINIVLQLAYIVCLVCSMVVSHNVDPLNHVERKASFQTFMLVSVTVREACTVFARVAAFPPLVVTLGTLACAIVFLMMLRAIWVLRDALVKSEASVRPHRIFFCSISLILRLSEAFSTVSLIAYAQGVVSAANAETSLCASLQIRLLVLVIRHTCTELFIDETATRVAEERLAMQQAADAARGALYRTIFHELRVPLNSIVLGLQLLPAHPTAASCGEEDGDHDVVNIMRESASSMLSLLSDLLDTAKLEARGLTLSLAPVDLRDLLHTTCRMMQPFAAGRNVQLSSTVSSAVPVAVLADRARLRQLISNFASNAIKFSPHDGTGRVELRIDVEDDSDQQRQFRQSVPLSPGVSPTSVSEIAPPTARSSATDGRVVYIISCVDNGAGVPLADRDKLFKPFAQLSGPDFATMDRSSGLGLSLCKAIAVLHGGTVGICDAAQPARGSVFFARLPLRPTNDAVIATMASSPRQPEPGSPTVLHVRAIAASASGVTLLGPNASRYALLDTSNATHSVANLLPHTPLVGADSAASSAATPSSILVVDDDAGSRKFLARLLQRRCPEALVEEAADGRAACDMACGRCPPYDLICLDYTMPVMGGLEAAREMRSRGVRSVIIGCTGNSLLEDQRAFINAGANAVCVKPLSVDDVLRASREERLN